MEGQKVSDTQTVLVVDDDSQIRKLVRVNLAARGYRVSEAVNGEDALEKARSLKPDIVLMDLIMPKMNGIEATHAIKKEFPQIKVLIVTSFTEIGRVIESIQAGASGFILKDAPLNEFLEAITTILQGKSWISKELTGALKNDYDEALDGIKGLSAREIEILRLMAVGKTDQEIMRILNSE